MERRPTIPLPFDDGCITLSHMAAQTKPAGTTLVSLRLDDGLLVSLKDIGDSMRPPADRSALIRQAVEEYVERKQREKAKDRRG
jgi:hypothetical protein